MKKRRLIVVLGMHRSGTSIITRGLQVLNINLGNQLMPPTPDNQKGYWEDVDINSLNIEMLNTLKNDWHHLAPVEARDIEILCKKGYLLNAVELLNKKIADTPAFGFKDPRTTKLLLFWKKVFSLCQLDTSYVLIVRHPISVARSLEKRDNFYAEKSYFLWLTYVLAGLSDTCGKKRILVDYDRLLQSPDQELNRIARHLNMKVDPVALENYRADFLDLGLRHSIYKMNDLLLDSSCPPLVREIYAFLQDVISDKISIEDPSLQRQIATWVSEYERLKPLFTLIDKLYTYSEHTMSLTKTLALREEEISRLHQELTRINEQIKILYTSASWRVTRPLRLIKSRVNLIMSRFVKKIQKILHGWRFTSYMLKESMGPYGMARKAIMVLRREGIDGIKRSLIRQKYNWYTHQRNDYPAWIRNYDTPTEESRANLRKRMAAFTYKPLISILMPTYNPKLEWLEKAIKSVRDQLYPHWELCIADDASSDSRILSTLRRYAAEDERIKVTFRRVNGHISVASNSALELANGEYIALFDHDDYLAEEALFWVVDTINCNPDACLIYSDEDRIDARGRRFNPYFKCEWNQDLFYSQNMISHLGVYLTSLVRDLGGFREGFEGSQDYDLALRVIERIDPRNICHIPRVLYHWRAHRNSTAQTAKAKPYAGLAAKKALNDSLARRGVTGHIELLDSGMFRVHYALPNPPPLVSLIVPTRNNVNLLRQLLISLTLKTNYPSYEILIIDNGSDEPETLQYLQKVVNDIRIRVIRDDSPFNFSALNNAAIKKARGQIVGLLNNDIEVISADWLTEMVSLAVQSGVGAVGAKLWYPNETLQHGGVILGLGGVAGHSHRHLVRGQNGYFGRACLIQSLSAVTAACLVIQKKIYEEVGGMNETNLAVALNDVDFCLRVQEAGYRNVWTPYAELYHHESVSRGIDDTPEKQARFEYERHYMQCRWRNQLLHDPAYSYNLTLEHEDFSFAWPPRIWPYWHSPIDELSIN